MTIDPGVINALLGVFGTAILTGIVAIIRMTIGQNRMLNDFLVRLTDHASRIKSLEEDRSRMWGIYDAYKQQLDHRTHQTDT